MNTTIQTASLIAALGLGVALGDFRADAQPAAQEQEADAAAPMDERMEAWMRAGTPGDHHRMLDTMVGTWDAAITIHMGEDVPPEVSTGRMTNEWILDGHFLRGDYRGSFMGQPFSGMSLFGYDNAAQTYRGVWVDSLSTHMQESAGYVSDDGKTWTMLTSATDPVTGEPTKGKDETVIESADRHTMTAWMEVEGEMVKSMEIVYTRAE